VISNGTVLDVTILSGPRVYHEAVKTAVMQYKCNKSIGGEVTVTQEFKFTITPNSPKSAKYSVNSLNVQNLQRVLFDKLFIDDVTNSGAIELDCRGTGVIYDEKDFDSFGLYLKTAMTRELQLAGKWSLSGTPLKIEIKKATLSTFPTGILNIEFAVTFPSGKTVNSKETNKFSDGVMLSCDGAKFALGETVSNALLNLYQNPDFASANNETRSNAVFTTQVDFNAEALKSSRILGCSALEAKVIGVEKENILYSVTCSDSRKLQLSCDPSGLCLQKK